MDKNKVLFVLEPNDKSDIFFDDWKKNGYQAEVLFKKTNKFLRGVRRVFMNNNTNMEFIWLNDWIKQLDKYEVLILHMSKLTKYLPELISKRYPSLRIICWYRNTIDDSNMPIKINNKNIEYWSFDEGDCKKYDLKHNIQYYVCSDLFETEKNIDLYFVGYEKGRQEKLDEIYSIATSNGIKCDFHIIGNDDNGFIPYKEVKKKLNSVKAVLEINKDKQIGFTLRTMESLFYGIKLITNNKAIKNDPIYNKKNIFIIDEDDYSNLYSFINSPYDHGSDALRKDYSLDTWFNNFFI